jgi:hypothetical protein
MASGEHGSHQPARSTDPQPDDTLAKGLASEDILEILRMILAGASLKEVLPSVARVIESHREGMLCSVWPLDQTPCTHAGYCSAKPSRILRCSA